MIEIPAVGLATRVLEGSKAGTLRLAVGHIPGTAPGPYRRRGIGSENWQADARLPNQRYHALPGLPGSEVRNARHC